MACGGVNALNPVCAQAVAQSPVVLPDLVWALILFAVSAVMIFAVVSLAALVDRRVTLPVRTGAVRQRRRG